ncbi:hypothetical protein HAV21_04205 [Paenarthrobacter sp. MSM-2-10-13]|uniref:hypothetical protein n=1 Tax=Paenarthrobacter sp. MSM-2-10-13 TaxID=2717318 RepID=UPI001420D7AE|nr:hypothetical protein [Paenarthrobacter sp. MSM-2-10-13]NHW46094.1 hypothetical protein [Paenarthrobacter sp. MSM-2-10-13]
MTTNTASEGARPEEALDSTANQESMATGAQSRTQGGGEKTGAQSRTQGGGEKTGAQSRTQGGGEKTGAQSRTQGGGEKTGAQSRTQGGGEKTGAQSRTQGGGEKTGAQTRTQGSSKKKERPKTVLGLIEFAYGEEGRKLNLVRRDLQELSLQPNAKQAEIDTVQLLAADDPFLAVPLSLLSAVAELGAEPRVRRHILDLVLVAFGSHKLFKRRMERLVEPQAQDLPTAHEVNEAVKALTFDALGFKMPSDFSEATRERLRWNAVTAVELFHVLHGHRTADQFIEDMTALVWDAEPVQSTSKAAAILVAARNTDAFSQLSRHFELRLRESKRETDNALARIRTQELCAIEAEAFSKKQSAELEDARNRMAELVADVNHLSQRLSAEQNSRVVDKSHHVDDYEALRTQVIRRLTTQVELLSDGLHALRNGSTGVAEEFVDRALSAIAGEVTRLKDLDGGVQ